MTCNFNWSHATTQEIIKGINRIHTELADKQFGFDVMIDGYKTELEAKDEKFNELQDKFDARQKFIDDLETELAKTDNYRTALRRMQQVIKVNQLMSRVGFITILEECNLTEDDL